MEFKLIRSKIVKKRVDEIAKKLPKAAAKFTAGAAIIAHREIVNHFEREEGPGGKKWKRLEPETIKRRKKHSSKPLQDTGQLKSSLAPDSGPDFAVVRVTRNRGRNVDLARIHNNGTSHIPPRKFFWLSKKTWLKIRKLFWTEYRKL